MFERREESGVAEPTCGLFLEPSVGAPAPGGGGERGVRDIIKKIRTTFYVFPAPVAIRRAEKNGISNIDTRDSFLTYIVRETRFDVKYNIFLSSDNDINKA